LKEFRDKLDVFLSEIETNTYEILSEIKAFCGVWNFGDICYIFDIGNPKLES